MTLLAIAFFAQVAVAPSMSLLSVYVDSVLHRQPTFTSALVSVQLLFGAIAAAVGGGLPDTQGRKRTVVIGISALPIVGVMFASRAPAAMFVLWAYFGFSFALYHLGRQSYTLAIVPPSRLGVAFAIMFTAVTLGGAVGNLLSAAIVRDLGFGTLGVADCMLALLVVIAAAVGIPEPARASGTGQRRVTVDYRSLLSQPKTRLLVLLQALPTAYYGTATLLMPLLVFRAAGRAEVAAYYGTATLVCASVGQLLAGRIMDRYGSRRALVALVTAIAAAALLTAAVTNSLWRLFVSGVVGTTLAWALSVAYPLLIREFFPAYEHGRTLGLLYLAWSVGMLAGTQLGGALVGVGAGLPFVVVGMANVGATLLAISLIRQPGVASQTAPEEDA